MGRDELGITIGHARSAKTPGRMAADVSFERPAPPATKPRRRVRRPPCPSNRARRADMHRSGFLTLVACWGAGLATLLALVLAIRLMG